jgi:choline dehydrogenase-like flavoprotein
MSADTSREKVDFDYIVVGSGAGGGPLAARLALGGKRVLVIEAGSNPADLPPTAGPREVRAVPSFNGLASEHPDLSWEFFVKHYTNPPPNPNGPPSDPKEHIDPDNPERTGIFYPRAAALGGCTIHNAMITICGPDSDWDDLADFVRDDSWRAETMRPYFEGLERNQYFKQSNPPRTGWGRFWANICWLFWREPDYTNGLHGYEGWLRTSVSDLRIGLKDRQLIKMLKAALWQANKAGIDRFATFVWHFLRGGVRRTRETLDPNHARTQADSPEGLAVIPLAVCGENGLPDDDGNPPLSMRGHRSGPREFLLEVQAQCPERLVIETGCFVTEILFEKDPPLRAIGVRFLRGDKVYHAHPTYNSPPTKTEEHRVRKGGEVILCGGSFNTPQLLMLSGIGDQEHLEEHGIQCRVHSPGVGRNLHDRYEVTVVSEMEENFELLAGAKFQLPIGSAQPDPFLEQWRQQGTGLYCSNGSVVGILKRSRPDLAQPDLFIFGLPLSFKGYELGYSKDPKHNFFTWAILKAHTRNRDGTVKLRNNNPLVTPDINFHYFEEESGQVDDDEADDLLALVDGVKFVRGIAKHAHLVVKREAHPGVIAPEDDDLAIKDWIRRESWGHHACGTCRMGPPEDQNAVLDSSFRVLGNAREGDEKRPFIPGLRVVDASIFPKIPGYFIVTNVYMASEKAADVILEEARSSSILTDSQTYPDEFRKHEAEAIRKRRSEVHKDPSDQDAVSIDPLAGDRWSEDVTGLAISGGGIRSATFNLGLLQALARVHCLRRIDFLSTVSGGSYIGSFLGRFFDRLRSEPFATGQRASVYPAADRVEHELVAPDSLEVRWLRKNGNYVAPSGNGDVQFNLAVLVRNLLSAHFVVGVLIFALFGLANAVRYGLFDKILAVQGLVLAKSELPIGHLIQAGLGAFWSPWFVLCELILLFAVLPRIIGYWMASEDIHERYKWPPLLLVFMFLAVLFYLGLHNGTHWEPLFLAFSLLTAFICVELAWRRGRYQEDATGTGGADTQKSRTRNYLTMDLGLALTLAGMALAFTLIDTAGHALQQLVAGSASYTAAFARFGALLVVLIPIVRIAASFLRKGQKAGQPPSTLGRIFKTELVAFLLALALLAVPLIFYSFAAHAAYRGGLAVLIGVLTTIFALVVSFILSRPAALTFVNRSSLSQTYASRLARTFLGASNPLRQHPLGANINEVTAGDDVSTVRDYRPHETGGPLHLINVTLNQTVDFTSQRGNRDRKSESMAVSSLGLSIGRRWHSLWTDPTEAALHAQGPGIVARVNAEQIVITKDGQAPRAGQGAQQGVYRYCLADFALSSSPNRLPKPVVKLGQLVKAGDLLATRWRCHKPHRACMQPVGWPLGTEHPLVDQNNNPAQCAETLSLRQWMAISGAAVAPGRGHETRLGTALLFGLANLRTGYWWDSSVTDTSRAGFPRLTFLRRLLYLLPKVFLTEALLISEWIARYPGPWERYWYLTDGGFFENLGAYELIRRRIPRIIVSDAGEDPAYQFGGMANLARKIRIDFCAELTAFTQDEINLHVPPPVRDLIGSLDQLKPIPGRSNDGGSTPTPQQAALFWVDYATQSGTRSVLLYLKAKLTGNESPDIANYHATHPEFPNESTADQFFDEEQWESYRQLGEQLASGPFAHPDWFWNIPVASSPQTNRNRPQT